MIDELAHAGSEHLDAAFVAGYDRKQGHPDPAEDLAVFEARGLDATSEVLDLAAGSGQFALAAARRFGHVTAVDVSPAMVARAPRAGGRRGAGQPGLSSGPASSAMSTPARPRTACTPAMPCISCPTSSRLSPWSASR